FTVMIDFHCSCGAPIRMPESAAGRRATCMTCNGKFIVPSPGSEVVAAAPRALAEDDLALEPEAPKAVSRIPSFVPPPAPPRESLYAGASRNAFEETRSARRRRSYWFDAVASFQAPLSPRGFAAILGLVTVLILAGFAPGILGVLAALFANGVLF